MSAFLAKEVRSLLALELLVLLRSDRQKRWTAEELVRELRATVEWAEGELAQLAARGLVEAAEGDDGARGVAKTYRFAASPPAAAESAIGWLTASYPARRFSIIRALYAEGRTGPAGPGGAAGGVGGVGGAAPESLRHFADAFEIRKNTGKADDRKEPRDG